MLNFVKNYLAKQGGKSKFHEALQKFLADGKLDDSEKQQLESLAAEYGFSKDELRDAHKKAASLMFKNIGSDSRITDEEKKGIPSVIRLDMEKIMKKIS